MASKISTIYVATREGIFVNITLHNIKNCLWKVQVWKLVNHFLKPTYGRWISIFNSCKIEWAYLSEKFSKTTYIRNLFFKLPSITSARTIPNDITLWLSNLQLQSIQLEAILFQLLLSNSHLPMTEKLSGVKIKLIKYCLQHFSVNWYGSHVPMRSEGICIRVTVKNLSTLQYLQRDGQN